MIINSKNLGIKKKKNEMCAHLVTLLILVVEVLCSSVVAPMEAERSCMKGSYESSRRTESAWNSQKRKANRQPGWTGRSFHI